jgi:uncharacterized protein YkwD
MFLPTAVLFCLAFPAVPAGDDPTDAALVAAHNRERAERKLPPLVAEPRLTAAARAHAADMASHQKMAHEGSDGSSPDDRVRRQKYIYLTTGENVAKGWESVEAVMTSWMNSPHHRENILGDYSEIGVARAEGPDGEPYWAVEFGRPFPRLDPTRAESDLADRLNHNRADEDKPPLRVSVRLSKAARAIARDSAIKILAREKKDKEKDASKAEPATPDPFERVKESGYRYMKITLTGSFGTPTPEETLKVLLANADQKAVLLGTGYTDLGVGYALAEDGRPSWSIILARPLK